jgi:hypothetical protein
LPAKVVVTFTAGTETRELESPTLRDEEAAEAMKKIRAAQNNGASIELDWLAMYGGNVVAAHIKKVSTSMPRAG